MRIIRSILTYGLVVPLLFFVSGRVVQAETVVVATWNIENLRSLGEGGEEKDLEVLTALAQRLDADIVALQEVDGSEAARQIFDPDEYDFFFSNRNHVQRTGFTIRKSLAVTQNPDYRQLNVTGGLRHGTDVTVMIDGQALRLLSVHLKSSCHSHDPLPDPEDNPNPSTHCEKLSAQVPVLEDWIDARADENVPFIVLGDFNRRFNEPDDTFFPQIDDGQPANADLVLATEGKISACLDGKFPEYIDHIVLDQLSVAWQVEDSFTQLLFDAELEDVVSDHCPISITLDTTQSGPPPVDEPNIMHELIDLLIEQLTDLLKELRRLRN